MPVIGHLSQSANKRDTLTQGHDYASLIPDCLVEARRVANIMIAGWHGRKKRGAGDNFWQFRQFTDGENIAQIDWRRSARGEHLYVRDKEWETTHTVWLWVDLSSSMTFCSQFSTVSKERHALVILFALAEILSRSGERIAMPGLMEPILARNGAERLAQALILSGKTKFKDSSLQDSFFKDSLPELSAIKRLSNIILISDFLGKSEQIIDHITPIAKRGTQGHLIEISDPAEEIFPYSGRIEFQDPETNGRLTTGKAATLKDDYVRIYHNRRAALSQQTRRLGWSFTHHRTDRSISDTLIAIHTLLSGMTNSSSKGF